MTLTLIRDIPPPATHYSPHHIVHTAAGPAQALFLVVRLYAASYLNVIINFFCRQVYLTALRRLGVSTATTPKTVDPLLFYP